MKEVGKINMTSRGLRKLADSIDMLYPKQMISIPVWKSENPKSEHLFLQLENGSGAINIVNV